VTKRAASFAAVALDHGYAAPTDVYPNPADVRAEGQQPKRDEPWAAAKRWLADERPDAPFAALRWALRGKR
jgi:hypothetical protein